MINAGSAPTAVEFGEPAATWQSPARAVDYSPDNLAAWASEAERSETVGRIGAVRPLPPSPIWPNTASGLVSRFEDDLDGHTAPGLVIFGRDLIARTAMLMPVVDARTMAPKLRRITLGEARRIAQAALLEAEQRRQHARQNEASFWTALDVSEGY